MKAKWTGIVTKVMKSAYAAGEETAEIAIDGADPLYKEIRIVNSFVTAGEVKAKLVEGTRISVTIEAESDVALKRAARVSDGWTSAMMTADQLAETIGKLKALLAEYGRADVPFEYQAVCIDKFGVDGHRELAEIGVTDNIVIPWVFDGLGFDAPLDKKKDSLKRFADTYIHSGWQG